MNSRELASVQSLYSLFKGGSVGGENGRGQVMIWARTSPASSHGSAVRLLAT